MSTKYSINFENNSTNYGKACIYQADPQMGPYVMSLAWFAKPAHPTTSIRFEWNLDYSFVWAETGELVPGVVFEASQAWEADLLGKNLVTFTMDKDAYTFTDLTKGENKGVLQIIQDSSIPLKHASVGIGMSGAGTFAVQAQPNLNLDFTPHPEYWITFGDYESGEVLDITQITNKAKIEFAPGVYSMDAILNEDNTWTIR